MHIFCIFAFVIYARRVQMKPARNTPSDELTFQFWNTDVKGEAVCVVHAQCS